MFQMFQRGRATPVARAGLAVGRVFAVGVLVGHVGVSTPCARASDRDPWFGHDKALHFSASAGIALTGYGAAALFTPREPPRLLAGGILALTAGVAKEIRDSQTGGDPSFRDLTWDAIGTASGLLVAWAIDRLVHRVMAPAR